MTKYKVRWKAFWDDLGFPVQKIETQLKKFKPERALKRLSIDFEIPDTTKQKIRRKFNNFENKKDKINFIYFNKFFRTHKNAILLYYKKDLEQSINKLLNAFPKKTREFEDIHFYNKWLRIGRGYNYNANLTLSKLQSIKRLRKGVLLPSHSRAKLCYKEISKPFFKDLLLIISRKGTQKNSKFQYIGFSLKENKIYFSPNISNLERYLILRNLTKRNIRINLNPNKESFKKLISFIKGELEEETLLELFGLTFEINGVIHRIRESSLKGKPEGKLHLEIQKSLPQELTISNIKGIELYNPNKVNRYKIDRYFINNSNGLLYLNLNSAKFSDEDYKIAIELFKSQFGISPEEAYLDPNFNVKSWYTKFLDHTSSSKSPWIEIPPAGLAIYNKLCEMNILERNSNTNSGWMCFTENCINKGEWVWSKSQPKCNECKNKLSKIKDEINYTKDEFGVLNYINKIVGDEGFVSTKITKQVLNKKLKILKILDNQQKNLSLVLAYNRNDIKHIKELCKRCSNLVVINAGANLEIIDDPIFKLSFGEFVYNYDCEKNEDLIKKAFLNQISKWDEKRVYWSDKACENLKKVHSSRNKPQNYKNIDFEVDCYNIINYLFYNTIWLGANESGEKLPDGIGKFPDSNYFMWDCKLSYAKNGLGVGSYAKNKEYLKFIGNNELIKKLGGLKNYIFISNNPNETNFKNICKKLKRYIRGDLSGINYTLLKSQQLLTLFDFIKEKQDELVNNPSIKNMIYEKINQFFIGDGIKIIEDDDMVELIQNLRKILDKNKIEPKLENHSFRN